MWSGAAAAPPVVPVSSEAQPSPGVSVSNPMSAARSDEVGTPRNATRQAAATWRAIACLFMASSWNPSHLADVEKQSQSKIPNWSDLLQALGGHWNELSHVMPR